MDIEDNSGYEVRGGDMSFGGNAERGVSFNNHQEFRAVSFNGDEEEDLPESSQAKADQRRPASPSSVQPE